MRRQQSGRELFGGVFYPARWPDGQLARTTDDGFCQVFCLVGIALALTFAVVTWIDGSFSTREVLIGMPIAPLTWFAMNWRLHVVVRRAGESGTPSRKARPRNLLDRWLESEVQKADQKANKLLARADHKESLGDDRNAARLRLLAEKKKAQVDSVRALIRRRQ